MCGGTRTGVGQRDADDEPVSRVDASAAARVREEMTRLGGEEALNHLYEHHGAGALEHLFRVASSLDSMVVGEAQILRRGQNIVVARYLDRVQAIELLTPLLDDA